jgi:tRNA(fMet)-specific endonuclease VapC
LARIRDTSAQVPLYERLLAQLLNYCNLTVLPFTPAAADRFRQLRILHRRVSSADLKIASIALENAAVLLTQNERDFSVVQGLQVEDWTR